MGQKLAAFEGVAASGKKKKRKSSKKGKKGKKAALATPLLTDSYQSPVKQGKPGNAAPKSAMARPPKP